MKDFCYFMTQALQHIFVQMIFANLPMGTKQFPQRSDTQTSASSEISPKSSPSSSSGSMLESEFDS